MENRLPKIIFKTGIAAVFLSACLYLAFFIFNTFEKNRLTAGYDKNRSSIEELSRRIGYNPTPQKIKNIGKSDPKVAFLLYSTSSNEDPIFYFNNKNIKKVASFLYADIKTNPLKTAKNLIKKRGPSSPTLDVITVTLYSKDMPVGIIKYGMLLEGHPNLAAILKTGNVLITISLIIGLLLIVASIVISKLPKNTEETNYTADGTDLNNIVSTNPWAGDTPVAAIAAPPDGWIPMYNGRDLSGWKIKGTAYANRDVIVVVPHMTSLVYKTTPKPPYMFRVEAVKLAGKDGFIIIFPLKGYHAVWAVGAFGNTVSELVGVTDTRLNITIEKNRWYELEVRVSDTSAAATLDGAKMWEINNLNEIKPVNMEREFLKGIGFGCFNTLCKYRNPVLKESIEDEQNKSQDDPTEEME